MLGQIVEITTDGSRLTLRRGFLQVSSPDGPLGQVPLDDIEAVIVSAPAVTYSNQLVVALAERGVPLVICSRQYSPAAFLLPVRGHHSLGERFEAQTNASRSLIERTWATLIKAKILAQASVLEEIGKSPDALRHLSKKVKSGDAGNVEATAAQRYWPALFGAEFHRDRSADDVNVYLNYGYTVLRAATARAIVGAGLHPSLGLHHKSGGDALSLSDDLMEPW